MNLIKRILSTLLAVILMLGTLSVVFTVPTFADDSTTDVSEIEKYYLKTVFNTPEEKLATMTWMYTDDSGRYSLYADANSGEVACVDNRSGNILFTNPYDVATISVDTTKYEVLSQIIIGYTDSSSTTTKYLYSFKDAAINEQIKVQQIKKGIRVEYTIGREDTKKLVPQLILEEDFNNGILIPLQEAVERGELEEMQYKMFTNRWNPIDVNTMKAYIRVEYLQKYPFLEKLATVDAEGNTVYPIMYDFRDNVNAADIQKTEDLIKKLTDYTYEQLEADHERTNYIAEDELYPAFKLALEYYADENGMSVRLPCNGLRYDMSNFTLESISVLPFIGAGNYTQDGYAFFPDGSGALFDYSTMASKNFEISGTVYGEDYAYHELIGMKYQRVIRYPVYGAVSTEKIYTYTYALDGVVSDVQRVSATVKSEATIRAELEKMGADLLENNFADPIVYTRGYMAIIEEADSLTQIKLQHGGVKHKYATMRTYFNPKPKDKYVFSGSSSMTVVSDRKYTGSYSVRFIMLCDDAIAAESKLAYPDTTFYSTYWIGMAKAYRDYLTKIGVLEALTEADVQADIPLYLESFGALETQETVATIPVYLMTPLTTFDNVLTMYNDLSINNVKNINFKLTGFANGGMYYSVPSSLKWEKKVGGKDGFETLVSEANKINQKDGYHLGLYPDFDFAYIQENTLFDSVILKDDAVKTIDNRYTSYRQYSPTQQTFVTFYQLALSPSRYSKFYTKLLEKYSEYGLKSISVASLGTALNSDFDEEDPYNREDSKEFTTLALDHINKQGYSIMIDGANAYTWEYVDHILNMDLDSSRYLESSASVPFIGTVLHGSVQFAGTPLNEEGDANYAMLRAIENGASLYFLLSYQNTAELKNDAVLSQYYSIRYDIWMEDVIKYYTTLNTVLKDVQTKQIINHEFIVGERILDLDELQAEILEKLEEAERLEAEKHKNEEIATSISVADAWELLYSAENKMSNIKSSIDVLNAKIANANAVYSSNVDFEAKINALNQAATDLAVAIEEEKNASAQEDETVKAEAAAKKEAAQLAYDEAFNAVVAQLDALYNAVFALVEYSVELSALKADADALVVAMPLAIEVIETTYVFEDREAEREAWLAQMNAWKANADAYVPQIAEAYNMYAATVVFDAESTDSLYVTAAKSVEDVFVNNVYGVADLKTLVNACSTKLFDMDILTTLHESRSERGEDTDNSMIGNINQNNDSNIIDNNRIVVVTYGNGDEPYKAFILNYNSFAVRVTYMGAVYTIGSGDYVVITEFANA